MAYTLQFGAPSANFLQKHGTPYCGCCKKANVRTKAEFIPQGWPKSVVFKREFASCAAHLEDTKAAAQRQLALDRDDRESEGEYQARTQFGI